jgi:hypothetical protein
VLTATTPGSAGSAVQMTFTDSTGQVVYSLLVNVGSTVSDTALLLVPGAYTVQFQVIGATPGMSDVTFSLQGGTFGDPIGPAVNDPTLKTPYKHPGVPGYVYPNGVASSNPYYFVGLAY